MYRLSQLIFYATLILTSSIAFAQSSSSTSPHGESLKIDCGQCHNPDGWEINYNTIKFDHNATDFRLDGAHKTTDCKECHQTLIFDEAPLDCASCHTDIHSNSVGNDCARCHTANDWLVDDIPQLHEENGFPLAGSHANLACVDCHTSDNNLTFTRLGNECINCHQDDFQSAKNPNHVALGYSVSCTDCHDPFSAGEWNATSINHDFFPLVGGHAIDCRQCHTGGDFDDLPTDCFSCHQDDYNATTNPNHITTGYSTTCQDCHSLEPGWRPAVADHSFFPLTLGHDNLLCSQCHTTPNFSDTSPDCFSCHQNDFNQATNPRHTGFPTDCVQCHTTNPDWQPSTFNHDQYFPIWNGNHAQGDAWNQCVDCHTNGNSGDFTTFSCFKCHTKPDMDDEHDDVNGYAYQNNLCLQCHPDGND